jgi:hypothetical protein
VRLEDAEEGITAAIRQRKQAEDRAQKAEAARDHWEHAATAIGALYAACENQRDEARAARDRVRDLHTDWLSNGAPPLGTSITRWWDKRLIELTAALDEPKEPTP